MKKLILLLIITASVFAQSGVTEKKKKPKIKINREELLRKKSELLTEREKLKNEIGELTKRLIKISDPNYRREICRNYFLKKYGRKIGNRILNGQIWKGMTKEMLRDSYGKPDKITRSKQKWGTFTQFYYGKQIFFFKNGKLFDWEQ